MRVEVDKLKAEYDNKVAQFKQTIGVDEESMSNLMVSIYNKFQDEILK